MIGLSVAPAADRLSAILPAASGTAANATASLKSQRLASGMADTALQSFLTIGPFEVRHEVSVVHFGHRHYRKNQYRAWITIVAVEGVWKLHRLDMIDEQRVL
jgi:hypothetical protein